jgi:hypothetical protein
MKAGHRAQSPQKRDYMKSLAIKFACYFEYCGIRPKEEWRLALCRVNVGATSVNDLVRDNGIHRFTFNWLRMDKGPKANHDSQDSNPKHG